MPHCYDSGASMRPVVNPSSNGVPPTPVEAKPTPEPESGPGRGRLVPAAGASDTMPGLGSGNSLSGAPTWCPKLRRGVRGREFWRRVDADSTEQGVGAGLGVPRNRRYRPETPRDPSAERGTRTPGPTRPVRRYTSPRETPQGRPEAPRSGPVLPIEAGRLIGPRRIRVAASFPGRGGGSRVLIPKGTPKAPLIAAGSTWTITQRRPRHQAHLRGTPDNGCAACRGTSRWFHPPGSSWPGHAPVYEHAVTNRQKTSRTWSRAAT
jgi:hypothetical protein